MKRALGLIDSKMAQAKNWLRDTNAQPGNQQMKSIHMEHIDACLFSLTAAQQNICMLKNFPLCVTHLITLGFVCVCA